MSPVGSSVRADLTEWVAPSPAWFGRLAGALHRERALLERLEDVLLAQRDAVERDHLAALEDGTHAARKILRTLAEAQRQRGALLEMGFGNAGTPLRELDGLGALLPPEVVDARRELELIVRRVSGTLALNRSLLEEAARSADRSVRSLLGPPVPCLTRGYAEGSADGRALGGGRHLNRQV